MKTLLATLFAASSAIADSYPPAISWMEAQTRLPVEINLTSRYNTQQTELILVDPFDIPAAELLHPMPVPFASALVYHFIVEGTETLAYVALVYGEDPIFCGIEEARITTSSETMMFIAPQTLADFIEQTHEVVRNRETISINWSQPPELRGSPYRGSILVEGFGSVPIVETTSNEQEFPVRRLINSSNETIAIFVDLTRTDPAESPLVPPPCPHLN